MKKSMLLSLCLTVCLQAAWAQNTVESIRQRYNNMKDYITTHTESDLYDGAEFGEYYHLQARQWLPGTGGHIEDTYLYWEEDDTEEEGVIYPPHHIKFATTKYNYAAREYYQEFLYDKEGELVFIYAFDPMTQMEGDEDDMQYEFRFYLNKGKLIQAIVKRKNWQEEEFKEVWSGSKLKPIYSDSFAEYQSAANNMRELFINIEKEAYR